MTPTVVCVKVGIKYHDHDVWKLRNGVNRFCKAPHEFICLTDQPINGIRCVEVPPGLPGWWAKIALFKPGLLPEGEKLYFDLDCVITGDLERAFSWDGFGIIDDWNMPTFNSSVMRFSEAEAHVWDRFQPRFMQLTRGDQDYITGVMPDARTFPRMWFPSYKLDTCYEAPPPEAMAVVFHGWPKPKHCGGWVPEYWA